MELDSFSTRCNQVFEVGKTMNILRKDFMDSESYAGSDDRKLLPQKRPGTTVKLNKSSLLFNTKRFPNTEILFFGGPTKYLFVPLMMLSTRNHELHIHLSCCFLSPSNALKMRPFQYQRPQKSSFFLFVWLHKTSTGLVAALFFFL